MASKKTPTEKTPEERLSEFRGRFRAFLRPGEVEHRAKLHQVPPSRRISQDRLAAVEHLRRGIVTCLEAYEAGQRTLADDLSRGVPIEPGCLSAVLGKNGRNSDVVIVQGTMAPIAYGVAGYPKQGASK